MKTVIITGATGFVGVNLAWRLLRDGHRVHVLVRPEHHGWRMNEIRSEVSFHSVEITDVDDVSRAVTEIQPDWIFHLAANGAYPSQRDAIQMAQTNIVGTMNLVQACLRVGFEAFVNSGSSSEYGYKHFAPSETEWLDPNSAYAVTKSAATLYCRFIAQSEDVHLPTLRLYSVYGPYEEPTRLMPSLIVRGMAGRLPPMVRATIGRDFVFIDDVLDAYVLAASTPDQERGAVYNVGTGIQTSLRDLVEIVRGILEISSEPVWGSMADRSWDTTVWVADNRRIREALGWEPHFAVDQGFRATLAWFMQDAQRLKWYQERLGDAG